MGLRLDRRQFHVVRRYAQIAPGRQLGDRNVLSAIEQELTICCTQSAGLAVGGNDDGRERQNHSIWSNRKWWLCSSRCFLGHEIVLVLLAGRTGAKFCVNRAKRGMTGLHRLAGLDRG